MHDTTQFTIILDIATSAWLVDFWIEKLFKKFYGRYQDLIEKYKRSVTQMVNNSFPG